jgi:hypothetical protein
MRVAKGADGLLDCTFACLQGLCDLDCADGSGLLA